MAAVITTHDIPTNNTTTNNEPTMEQLRARIAQLEREQEQARASKYTVSFKVSEKGGVSAYGLGRFPVTLYAEQWGALLDNADRVKGFIERNRGSLKVKGE